MENFRIVVFSDSHGYYGPLENIILSNKDETDAFIHLGDGEKEVEEIKSRHPDITLYAVRGNSDSNSSFNLAEENPTPLRLTIEIGGKKILCVHGHEQAVKWELDLLKKSAKSNHADIVLYGHTHTSYTEYDDGLYIMNPGSTSIPASGKPSYGRIDITGAGIVTNVIEI